MRYIKYMPYHTMYNDSRDRRELMTAIEQGFEVAVFSSDIDKKNLLLPDSVELINDGTKKITYAMSRAQRILQFIKNKLIVFKSTRHLRADVLSCYDIESFSLAYFSTRFVRHKPQLIYDSHEFEIGRNSSRSKYASWRVKQLERFLIKRCAYSTMVNDSIADEVQRIYKLKQRPVVLRSTPTYWKLNNERIIAQREKFAEVLHHPKWIMMYHGILTTGRGIETVIQLTAMLDGVGLVILGDARTETYELKLKTLVRELNLEDRVLFHPAVPIDELSNYVGAVDSGMVFTETPSLSYYYSLPNKVFENIQSLTPIIATELPEVTKIIREYEIGLTCPVGDLEGAKACVTRLMTDPVLYQSMKQNLTRAKNDLCWENEKKKLIDAWEMYLIKKT